MGICELTIRMIFALRQVCRDTLGTFEVSGPCSRHSGSQSNISQLSRRLDPRFTHLDGPTIRNANRGDSRELIRRKNPIFMTFERFARIVKPAIHYSSAQNAIRKKGGSVRGLSDDSRESTRANQAI